MTEIWQGIIVGLVLVVVSLIGIRIKEGREKMSRDEILAMQPGPEMDALVAEKVTGRLVTWNRAFLYLTEEEKKSDIRSFADIPNHSTDISAAWLVAEKAKQPFNILRAYKEQYKVGDLGWVVSWCNDNECKCSYTDDKCLHDKNIWAFAVPEAICKAALLAVMDL